MRRKYGIRKRYMPKRRRSIFKRFIKRTAIKPELKWVTADQTFSSTTTTSSRAFSAVAIPQGTAVNNHIGGQCNLIKVDYRMYLVYNRDTVAQRLSDTGRYVLWTPRVDLGKATAYMNTISVTTIIDIQYVTIHEDRLVYLSPNDTQSGSTVTPGSGPMKNNVVVTGSCKFPRKVKFPSVTADISDLDDEKNIMYITNVNQSARYDYDCRTKLWFFDS